MGVLHCNNAYTVKNDSTVPSGKHAAGNLSFPTHKSYLQMEGFQPAMLDIFGSPKGSRDSVVEAAINGGLVTNTCTSKPKVRAVIDNVLLDKCDTWRAP